MEDRPRNLTRPDGAVIAYRRIGDGKGRPALMLLHGVASNRTRWWEFAEKTDLISDWDLLFPDLRGHGESRFRGRVGMEIWADDLAAILSAEDVSRAVIGGHCLGANLAAFFASRHSDRTAGVVLVEPMPPDAAAGILKKILPLRPVAAAIVLMIRGLNAVGIHRRSLPVIDLKELDVATREAMAGEGSQAAMMKRYGSPRHDLKYLPVAVYLQDFFEVGRPLPPLSEIRVPVLSLVSTGRYLSDPALVRDRLDALPDGRTVEIPARHWIPTEQPDAMRREIESFCRSLSITSGA